MTSGPSAAAPVDTAEVVTLDLPARAKHLRLARLTAAGMGAELGFGLDEIEDLRVAVDEACAVIIDGVEPAVRLRVQYEVRGRSLVVTGRCHAADAAQVHPVARELLNVTADEWDVAFDERDGRSFHVHKVAADGAS